MNTETKTGNCAVATKKSAAKPRNKRPQLRVRVCQKNYNQYHNQSRAVDTILLLFAFCPDPRKWLELGDQLAEASRFRLAGGAVGYNKTVDKLLTDIQKL